MHSQSTPDSGFSSDSSTDHQLCDLKRIKDVKKQIADIKTEREAFLIKYMIMYKDIENMIRNMLRFAKTSQQNLKSRLQEFGSAKALEWDRQIKLCKDAAKNVRNFDEATLCEFFARNIGFIETGDMKFVSWCGPVVREVEKFGTLSWSDKPEKLNPKLIITGHLRRPWGVCSDATGRILVTDCDNDTVHVFNELGKFIFYFGKSGTEFGEFDSPTGIASDGDRIIVSDRNNNRIQVFEFTGRFIHSFGKRGKEAGEFQHPEDVAVNKDGDIAVSDRKNIQIFNSQGGFIAQFCLKPDFRPRGLVFKPDNGLLVADGSNRCVLFIDKFFKTAVKIGGFLKPQSAACNRSGMFAVFDSGNKTIKVIDDYGNLYKSFNVEEFGCLTGICLLSDGGIIAADSGHKRVLMF